MKRSCGFRFCFLSTILFLCVNTVHAKTPAEELAQKVVGDDTLGFVATSGTDHIGQAFRESTLGMLWNDQQLQQFVESLESAIVQNVQMEIGEGQEGVNEFKDFAGSALSCPTVLVVSGDPVRTAFVIDASRNKVELEKAYKALLAVDPNAVTDKITFEGYELNSSIDEMMHGYHGFVDDYFVAAFDDKQGKTVKRLLRSQTSHLDRFGELQANGDALAIYVDFPRIMKKVESLAEKENNPGDVEDVKIVLNKLGFLNTGVIAERLGFAGKDLACDTLIEIQGQPTGLWTTLKPVDYSILQVIDDRVMNVTLLNCDFGKAVDIVVDAVKAVAPAHDFAEMKQQYTAWEEKIGVSVRKDIIDAMAGPMAFYAVPSGAVMDAPRGAFAAVIKMSNEQKMDNLISKVAQIAKTLQSQEIQFSVVEKGGRTYYYLSSTALSFMGILPSWTVDGDYLILASSAALCEQTANELSRGKTAGNSIVTSERYKAAVPNQLPKDAVFFRYVDSQAQLRHTIMSAQQFWPMMTMGLSQQGIKLPVMLPNFASVIDKVQGSYTYAQFTDNGFESEYRGTGLEPAVAGAIGGISAAVAIPAVHQTRIIAREVAAGSQLRQIGHAAYSYATENNDQFPPNLEVLIQKGYLDVLPESPRKPDSFSGPSYIYVSGRSVASEPDEVLAFENPDFLAEGDEINVLFIDSHVERMPISEFRKIAAEDDNIK
ncbi:hypothetical protein STSP2_02004 [Anaerohalosphaera lusitana]|uniref:DUF3352 domain-containing protein n=1 Tax=Anaerohalosphaera lusitana TaxID=1936003 RepID=A0A1U9NM77_9BACT|nr:hypothetical protein [Anaerohalosphaera lusitana]AQT68828.1 hypothetical protein STSP2_02004 [Anaerohalosphaera lusitana]